MTPTQGTNAPLPAAALRSPARRISTSNRAASAYKEVDHQPREDIFDVVANDSRRVLAQGDREQNDEGCLQCGHRAMLQNPGNGSDEAPIDVGVVGRTPQNLFDVQVPVSVSERRPGTFDGESRVNQCPVHVLAAQTSLGQDIEEAANDLQKGGL